MLPLVAVEVIGALTVMLPAWLPAPVVEMVTLVPALSRVLMLVLRILESLPVPVSVLLLLVNDSVPLATISML